MINVRARTHPACDRGALFLCAEVAIKGLQSSLQDVLASRELNPAFLDRLAAMKSSYEN